MREAVAGCPGTDSSWRSIPACAGGSTSCPRATRSWTVHPRVRGEQFFDKAWVAARAGPSPHTRGAVSVTWHLTNDKQLFLQLLEKPTNQTPRTQRPTLATQHTPHPEAPPPTPTGLQHSGSVRPPRNRQRSTCTQRSIQRTPPTPAVHKS